MTSANAIKLIAGKFYGLDTVRPGVIVSGPYETSREANADIRQMNIADDVVVGEAYVFTRPDGNRVFKMRPAK